MNAHSELVNAVLLKIGALPDVRCWKQHTGVFEIPDTDKRIKVGVKGQADISGILSNGKRLEIECKTGSGRLSDRQKKFAEMIKRYHGVYGVVRSAQEAEELIQVALKAA